MNLTLNAFIDDILKSSTILIAARCGIGKTSFALHIAEEAAKMRLTKRVAIFNLSDSAKSLDEIKETLSTIGNIALVIIDYVQLLQDDSNQDFSYILQEFKTLNMPVVVVSQVSRNCVEREDKRPILADLHSSVVSCCDIIAFLHRDSCYEPECDPNHGECIIARNCHGETGTIMFD
jgi:replicative DNA helicase